MTLVLILEHHNLVLGTLVAPPPPPLNFKGFNNKVKNFTRNRRKKMICWGSPSGTEFDSVSI